MPSNTVENVLKRFMKNPHREQFMKENNLTLAQAAVVFFRRHTNSKMWYAGNNWLEHNMKRWWEIPVSHVELPRIKAETLAKYQAIVNDLITAEL
jgi:hypothetical protein